MEILLLMAVFIGLMYVMMILPQRKRMEKQKKMLNELVPGTRVLLNTGIFGTIRATGDQQMVVELAPGVEVTILKQAVVRAANPDEEEFEYSDGSATAAPNDEFFADGAVADTPDFEQPPLAGDAEQAAAGTEQAAAPDAEQDISENQAATAAADSLVTGNATTTPASPAAGERPQDR